MTAILIASVPRAGGEPRGEVSTYGIKTGETYG